MSDTVKWALQAVVVVTLGGLLASTFASTPRGNCYTCIERCAPFRVGACEPAWSHWQPMYCACDTFSRVDEPTATPKGK